MILFLQTFYLFFSLNSRTSFKESILLITSCYSAMGWGGLFSSLAVIELWARNILNISCYWAVSQKVFCSSPLIKWYVEQFSHQQLLLSCGLKSYSSPHQLLWSCESGWIILIICYYKLESRRAFSSSAVIELRVKKYSSHYQLLLICKLITADDEKNGPWN